MKDRYFIIHSSLAIEHNFFLGCYLSFITNNKFSLYPVFIALFNIHKFSWIFPSKHYHAVPFVCFFRMIHLLSRYIIIKCLLLVNQINGILRNLSRLNGHPFCLVCQVHEEFLIHYPSVHLAAERLKNFKHRDHWRKILCIFDVLILFLY